MPTTVTSTLIQSARVTCPPAKIVTYAERSSSRGITTMPPAALIVSRDGEARDEDRPQRKEHGEHDER